MGGFSLWHWLIVLVIVVLVFGTKRLKNVGQDLGEAVKGFKKGIHDDKSGDDGKPDAQLPDTRPTTAPPAASTPASTDGTASGDSDTSTDHTRTPR